MKIQVRPGGVCNLYGPLKLNIKSATLDDGYGNTIIARDALAYVWLVSRDKKLLHEQIVKFTEMIKAMGYGTDNPGIVPQ